MARASDHGGVEAAMRELRARWMLFLRLVGVLWLREEASVTREELAMDLLQTLGLATWNDETQTDDVDAEQVAEVLAAFDAACELAQVKP